MSIAQCPPSTPVAHGVVVFEPAPFKAAFPEFAAVADAALSFNFQLATVLLNNSCKSLVCDAAKRELLLNLLVAHITQLRNGVNGQPPSGAVGRVSSAQEGSVRADLDMGAINPNAAYFLQTQYGAMYWQMTAPYRVFRYIPAPVVCADLAGLPPGFGYGYPGYPGG